MLHDLLRHHHHLRQLQLHQRLHRHQRLLAIGVEPNETTGPTIDSGVRIAASETEANVERVHEVHTDMHEDVDIKLVSNVGE